MRCARSPNLKQQQLERLKVKAGVDGVLVEMPLQVGQHVLPGTELAKIVQPNHLMAELKIPETQARDVQIGEPASIDTHNGVIAGEVQPRRSRRAERHGHGRREADGRVAQGRAS